MRKKTKFLLTFFIIAFIFSINIKAQDNNKGSLNFIIADSIFHIEESSYNLAIKTLEIANADNIESERGIAYGNIGLSYLNSEKLDSALYYSEKALRIAEKFKVKDQLAVAYNQMGIVYMVQDINSDAIGYFLKAATIFEGNKNYSNLSNVELNIGSIYVGIKEADKGEVYYLKSLKHAEMLNDYDKSVVIASLGMLYNQMGKHSKSLIYLEKALKIFESEERIIDIIRTNVVQSENYIHLNKPQNSLELVLKAYKLSNFINDTDLVGYTGPFVAGAYIKLNKFDSAEYYLKKTLSISLEYQDYLSVLNSYDSFRELYTKQKKYKEALFYFEKYTELNDSLAREYNKEKVYELETIYQSEKKDKKIKILANNKKIASLNLKQKNTVILSISIISVFILILMFVFIISLRKRQKIKQQLLQEKANLQLAETEQRMLASIIETEDAERKRFAEDLHDGLGPLLSTIKLYVGELKSDDQKISILLNSIINDAIKNIRAISYNIMPIELTENGIESAIKIFCEKITFVNQININIDSNINNHKFKWSVEKILYRVLTELVNNSLKHSEATEININMNLEENNLLVVFFDNGKGFNVKEKLDNKTAGLGLKNIINRIEIINGTVNINSDSNGTEFVIKIDF